MSDPTQPNSTSESDNVELDPNAPAEEGASSEAPLDSVELEDVELDDASVVDIVSGERDAFRDALQHLQADFENYRKRMVKQQGEAAEQANASLVTKLLPVLDTIDLAKAHEPSGSLEQVSSALLEVLTKDGLERIAAVEQPFDPNLHEAVAHEPGDGGPRVSEEMRAGYRWKGRVLRPAMVKVIG